MIKTIIKIEGMMCNMCEKHVNEAISSAFDIKKAESSHEKGETEVISENVLDEAKLKEIIEKDGYKVLGITSEIYEKKGLGSIFRK